VLSTFAMVAVPVLALMLIMGGVAKIASAGSEAEPGGLSRLGPAVLAPERFRKPVMLLFALIELGLAAALLFSGHPVPRWATVAFFAVATYVLWDLRRRRPDAGCGCFGDVSSTPVGLRPIARTVVLTAMAVLVAVQSSGTMPRPGATWMLVISISSVLALLLLLSPEIEEVVARLRYRAPCELRPIPADRALSRLRASTAWRSHAGILEADQPDDMWRELCWRVFVFPGQEGTQVVFAVYLSGRRPPVRAAVVNADGRPVGSLPASIPVSA
jgi:hypothetical protein